MDAFAKWTRPEVPAWTASARRMSAWWYGTWTDTDVTTFSLGFNSSQMNKVAPSFDPGMRKMKGTESWYVDVGIFSRGIQRWYPLGQHPSVGPGANDKPCKDTKNRYLRRFYFHCNPFRGVSSQKEIASVGGEARAFCQQKYGAAIKTCNCCGQVGRC